MNSFEGLLFYETVLLILGVVLFVVLLIVLIILVAQKRSLKGLLAFFLVPILMIGFSAVQKIGYRDLLVEFDRNLKAAEQNPDNQQARAKLAETAREVQRRNPSEAKTKIVLAKADAVLGDTLRALEIVDQVLAEQPGDTEAKRLGVQLRTPRIQVEEVVSNLQKKPTKNDDRADLTEKLRVLEQSGNLSVSDYVTLARGFGILGDSSRVSQFADSALKRDSSVKLPLNTVRFIKPPRKNDTAQP